MGNTKSVNREAGAKAGVKEVGEGDKEIGKKEATEKTVRQLKTEQSNKITSGTGTESDDTYREKKQNKIKYQSRQIDF